MSSEKDHVDFKQEVSDERIPERIKMIVSKEGISMRLFEKTIGCSNGVISKAIVKRTRINSEWLSRIVEAFPWYDMEWLITGKGEMFKKFYPEVSEPEQAYGLAVVDSHIASEEQNASPSSSDRVLVNRNMLSQLLGTISLMKEQLRLLEERIESFNIDS